MSNVYLETERMVFKKITTDDAQLFFELDADPEVMTYISGGKASTLAACEASISRVTAQLQKYEDKFGAWWAYSKETEERLGWFLLRPDKLRPDTVESPELGYRFYKKYWGKGYATEGSKALVDKAFNELSCESVYAVAMKDNRASQHVMKKVGMSFMGEYQQDECSAPGEDTEAVHFKITKEEWENEKKN